MAIYFLLTLCILLKAQICLCLLLQWLFAILRMKSKLSHRASEALMTSTCLPHQQHSLFFPPLSQPHPHPAPPSHTPTISSNSNCILFSHTEFHLAS